ncbi:MAG: threonine synthase, partial [Lentisphaerae bacterium]|nr:threonine synthase [Lentisphaerota bacterium]
ENDSLAGFFSSGIYRRGKVQATLSPSMDIQVASNFERYLYYRVESNPREVCRLMEAFAQGGELRLSGIGATGVDPRIVVGAAATIAALATIKEIYEQHGYLLDPHSAVGVSVGRKFLKADESTLALATAHPAKFAEAVLKATGRDLARHPELDALVGKPQRRAVLSADVEAVRAFLRERIP